MDECFMNRHQRRKAGIKEKAKTYTLTDQQIRKLKEDAVKEASEKAFVAMLGLPLLTLRDEFDFEKDGLERFMDRLLLKYECFDKGYVSLEDLKQVIKEETGVEISEWR